MNRQSSIRHLNYSHIFLISGLVLSLLVVMFRPAGADAGSLTSVDVFENADADTAPATVKVNDLPKINNVDYNVVLHGQKKPVKVGLSGVPLIEFLKNGGVKTEGVQFVKIRYGTTNDAAISLVPLNQSDTERPPIILTAGKRPGLGPFKTPSVVPGQPDFTQPISEDAFTAFSTKGPRLKIVPGAPGARIMSIRITKKQRKSGEYTLSARVHSGGGSGAKAYQWYGFDAKNQPVDLGTGPSIETKDATSGTSTHQINVIVTERGTGSTGTSFETYTARKKAKGATKNPYPAPTQSTGGNTGAGTGTGTGAGTGALGGGVTSNLPNTTTTTPGQTTTTTPTPETSVPTGVTSGIDSAGPDSTAITNAAQNVSGTGKLTTVSGVLLSAPTVMPSSGGSGSPISALPAPVATQLNSIFQPVNDVNDAWAYLLALLFAFTFSGAVREWVKP